MNLEDCPFENKKIREVFDLATETWPEALVKEYRRKEKAKEQKTSLPSKAEKTYLLKRENHVTKVCITQAFAGHHYVLVAPPLRTLEEDRGFKLPGGKCSHKDMLPEDDGAYVAVRAAIQNDIWGDAASKLEAEELLIRHVLGGLREANEELPFPTVLDLGPKADPRWLFYPRAVGGFRLEKTLPNNEAYAVLSLRKVEAHRDRAKEAEQRYPNIHRTSTLIYMHAELVDPTGKHPINEPIVLSTEDRQTAGETCRWIPATPSIIEALSDKPWDELPTRLLYEVLSISSSRRTGTPAHHIHSLIESMFSSQPDEGGTTMSILIEWDRLREEIQKELQDQNGMLAEDVREPKKFEEATQIVDLPGKGYRVAPTGHFDDDTPPRAYHNRDEAIKLQSLSGILFQNGRMKHRFRYRQPKRTSRQVMLSELDAIIRVKTARERAREERDSTSGKKSKNRRSATPHTVQKVAPTATSHMAARLSSKDNESTTLSPDERDARDASGYLKSNPFSPEIEYLESFESFLKWLGDKAVLSEQTRKVLKEFSSPARWNPHRTRLADSFEKMKARNCSACDKEAGEHCDEEQRQPLFFSAPYEGIVEGVIKRGDAPKIPEAAVMARILFQHQKEIFRVNEDGEPGHGSDMTPVLKNMNFLNEHGEPEARIS